MAPRLHAEPGVIINEVMYHPPDDRDDLQFIELFNAGANSADVSGWSLDEGVKCTVPAGTELPAGGFGVFCRNGAAFAAHYGRQAKVLGVFAGRLKHGGDKLRLLNAQGALVDSVHFDDKAPWPAGPDGHSPSLERICPSEPGVDPSNWAASALPEFSRPAGTPGRRNDSYSAKPLPRVEKAVHTTPAPNQPTTVTAEAEAEAGIKSVTLIWEAGTIDIKSKGAEVVMSRIDGDAKRGGYRAEIPSLPPGHLVRFRIRALSENGTSREFPAAHEPRPALSFSTFSTTNAARVPLLHILTFGSREQAGPSMHNGRRSDEDQGRKPARGAAAVVAIAPGGKGVEVFDFVRVRPRASGLKVKFQNDRPYQGLDAINVIYETGRSALSEPMSFDLYRMTGVPAPQTRHARVWVNGRPLGYQLIVEQPNKAFLKHSGRSEDGNLYKLLWYEQGPARQHEKKTNIRTGHADLLATLDKLKVKNPAAQWEVIQNQFNVEEFINYFAVNMCIQNWDGFFNNYYVYRDTKPGSKWEIYPWDEDKTWGAYDGSNEQYDWYDMPLTMGMNGDQPPGSRGFFRFGGDGPFGGGPWWRPPGWFSGPLLANPEFRKRFLVRLREICETIFIPEKMEPLISALENRLEPEIVFRAQLNRENPADALKRFRRNIDSFRTQVVQRRKFILRELVNGK